MIMVLIMPAGCIFFALLYFGVIPALLKAPWASFGCCFVTSRIYLEAALGADAEWPRWGQQAEQASVRLATKVAACSLSGFTFFL